MDAINGTSSPATSRPLSTMPSRDDCWSEDATFTLIQAWGCRYLDLNRGNLRQKHWQEVADAVNDRHFTVNHGASVAKPQPYRSDVQCKNRIDTLKKKYKIEKARVSESSGTYISPWPFFLALDDLLRRHLPASGTPDSDDKQRLTPPVAMTPFPVAPRSAISRRPAPAPALLHLGTDEPSNCRGNLSAFAAAAAAAAALPASEDDSEGSRSRSSGQSGSNRKRGRDGERKDAYREVANAIERLGEIYERVEERKRREMVELEKQRMRFAKELECHRMQLFTEMQVRLHKLMRVNVDRGSSSSMAAAAGETRELSIPVVFLICLDLFSFFICSVLRRSCFSS